MRFSLFTIFLTVALAALLTAAQDVQIERSLDAATPVSHAGVLSERDLLEARQATNTTSSSAPASTASGSAPLGGDATITEASCSYTNHLAVNQQASWGSGIINTCCGFASGTECWYRRQANVAPQDECNIPSCADLQSDDPARMDGFIPLTSTNGSGKYKNIFLSLGQLSAASIALPAFWLSLSVALASIIASTFF